MEVCCTNVECPLFIPASRGTWFFVCDWRPSGGKIPSIGRKIRCRRRNVGEGQSVKDTAIINPFIETGPVCKQIKLTRFTKIRIPFTNYSMIQKTKMKINNSTRLVCNSEAESKLSSKAKFECAKNNQSSD